MKLDRTEFILRLEKLYSVMADTQEIIVSRTVYEKYATNMEVDNTVWDKNDILSLLREFYNSWEMISEERLYIIMILCNDIYRQIMTNNYFIVIDIKI